MNRTRVQNACALCTVREEKISQVGREVKILGVDCGRKMEGVVR